MIQKTKYDSYCSKGISTGCKYCVQGRKLVLFVSGKCPRNCFYCPLSEKRKSKDNVWANERKLSNNLAVNEAIEEAKICNSAGMGITGGDPLIVLNRTLKFIKLFKKNFGSKFHIHIYLIPQTAKESNLKMLFEAGVDEVRFHPTILTNKTCEEEVQKIKLASRFKWDVGIEIPAIPRMEKKIFDLIDKTHNFISFINLNELEVSDANLPLFKNKGYGIDKNDPTRYIIKGSRESALKILQYCNKRYPKLLAHFCSARIKNIFQYKQRLAIRAKNVKTRFDEITKYSDLQRSVIYLENFAPGFGYERKIENLKDKDWKKLFAELNKKKKELIKLGIPASELIIDKVNMRFVTSRRVIEKLTEEIKMLNLKPARVEELPTYYSLPLEIDFL